MTVDVKWTSIIFMGVCMVKSNFEKEPVDESEGINLKYFLFL
jgi:hypothetical protein